MTTSGRLDSQAVYCNQCGHRNPVGANFCSSCGASLEVVAGEDATITFTPEGTPDGDDDFAVGLDDLEPGTAMLVVKRGPNSGSKFLLDRDLVKAGRHPDSEIFLDDITVSRRHADFVRQAGGFQLRDDGSLNGTYLNRERIETAELVNGDEVQIGKFKLVYLVGGATI